MILSLLRSKNRCLVKFLETSKAFVAEIQGGGELPSLVEFETRREAILKAILLFDQKVTEAVSKLSPKERTPELSLAVEEALIEKDVILREIMATDEIVLRRVEEEKNRVARELTAAQKSSAVLQKFKSSWVNESGEEIDQKL